jgi:hypothetical protein
MLRLRDNIKWTLCIYHKTRKYVSGQQHALSALHEVKESQEEEWVDVSPFEGFETTRVQT